MKKALISAAAVAALMGAGAAQAEVTAYGLFDISVGKSIYGDAFGNDVSLHSGTDGGAEEGNSATRFGLKGSTDLGSGMKANFNYQAGINGAGETHASIDTSTGEKERLQLFNRAAWGGLSGGFGEVRYGRQDSVPMQIFAPLDYNGLSNGTSIAAHTSYNDGIWGGVILGRQSNSLQYISPSLGGLTVQLGYVMSAAENDYDDTVESGEGLKNVVSTGLTYVVGPVTLAAAYQSSSVKDDDLATADFDETAAYTGFGAQYDFGSFKVKADYQKWDTQNQINFGAVTTLAGWTTGVQYSIATDKSHQVTIEDRKTSGYELFVNKEVLKNVYGYAEVGSLKVDEGKYEGSQSDKATGFAVGMILVF